MQSSRCYQFFMDVEPNFFRSLLLASAIAFVTPSLLLGLAIACLWLLGNIPGLVAIGRYGSNALLQFLATFGRGHPLEGVLAIALSCSVVAALFETYAFSQYPSERHKN